MAGIPKNQLRTRNSIEQYEHEDDASARRVTFVGPNGNFLGHDPSVPLYVALSDGSVEIGTVNADLDVQLEHDGASPDSTQIGDGQDILGINSDGSINVNLTPTNTNVRIESYFNEVSSVPSSSLTVLNTFMAPTNQTTYLSKVRVSGGNIAIYTVKKNGNIVDKVRTYFGGSFNEELDFKASGQGLLLQPGDSVSVEVEHFRPSAADFNARIETIEI